MQRIQTTNAHKRALFLGVDTELARAGKLLKTTKPLRRVACRFKCGSKGIRTPDPLLVRQMLWTSWAMLPFVKAWDCKGKHYFLICKFFDKFFLRVSSSFEARPRIFCLSAASDFPPPTFGHHHCSLSFATSFSCIPRTWAPEQGLEPRTPWLTVMCSNQLSYSGIVKNRYLSIAVQR